MFDHKRRYFLKSLVTETIAMAEELSGTPQFRLDELETVPDDILGDMVPVFNTGRPSKIADGWLSAWDVKNGEFRRFHKLCDHEAYILTCFDGSHSVSGICNRLESDFQIRWDKAFSTVKNLFVRLSEAAICHPAGGHE